MKEITLTGEDRAAIALMVRGVKQSLECLKPGLDALPVRTRRMLPGLGWMNVWIGNLGHALELLGAE